MAYGPQDPKPKEVKPKKSPIIPAIVGNVNRYLYSRPGITPALLDSLVAVTQGNRKTPVTVDSMPIPSGTFWRTRRGGIIAGEFFNPRDRIELNAGLDGWLKGELARPSEGNSRDILLHEFGHRFMPWWSGEDDADRFKDVFSLITRSKQDPAVLERRLSYGNPQVAEISNLIFKALRERVAR